MLNFSIHMVDSPRSFEFPKTVQKLRRKKKKRKKKKKERKEKRKWQFRTQNMFLLVPWKVQLIKDILNLKKHS
jgi:hypothetical protein